MIVRIADIRAAGYCVKGARKWFELHDLDFKAFLRDGIPAAELVEKGDALAKRVVEMKRVRDGR